MKTITLGDLVAGRPLVTVHSEATVQDAVEKMVAARKGAALIVKDGRLQGMFTERDLMVRVVAADRNPRQTQVGEVMTKELVLGRPEDSYMTSLQKMVSANCRHLPIVEGDHVVGIVSRRQLMALDIRQLEDELERVDPSKLFI